MKSGTQALLYQCRSALLQRPDEQVDALLRGWFECMIGDEELDETLDDLCLLLDYSIGSEGATTSYDTYTAWWEVEGYQGDGDGEFRCADIGSLRLRLLDMSIKEFSLLVEVAYQARSIENEISLPTGHEGLREFIAWLESDAPGTLYAERETSSLTTALRAQESMTVQETVDLASQQGYLVVGSTTRGKAIEAFRLCCKTQSQPYIWVESMGPYLARLCVETGTVSKRDPHETHPQLDEHIKELAAPYLSRTQANSYQARVFWAARKRLVFEWILAADAEAAARELVALWAQLRAEARQLAAQREAERLAALEPMWSRELKGWKAPEQPPKLPLLSEAIVLPHEWGELFKREELSAFLAFLGQPTRSRDAKPALVQSVQEQLERDPAVRAQFFELFRRELAVPPWELETLLACTPTERKRWTEEGRLPVLEQRAFRKGGIIHDYPTFDRRIILSLTPTEIEQWRAEHQAQVKARRSESARAAAAARKVQQQAEEAQAANTSGSAPR